jgi:hypothetical protein
MKTSLTYKLVQVAKRFNVSFDVNSDPAVHDMLAEIKRLGGIQFRVELAADGDWLAKSTNIDGILTGGSANEDKDELMKDAVFTYYGISPKHCEDSLLRTAGESKVIRQDVLVAA